MPLASLALTLSPELLVSTPFFGGDIVAVFNSSFQQVFQYARPVNVNVRETSRLLDHPLETGQIITDYAIIMPVEIELSVIVEAPFYRDTYQQILALYTMKELLTVQTRANNYLNMVIGEIPHEEKSEMYDALPMTIRFRQAQVVPSISTYAPADPTQANTVQAGEQNGYPVSGVQTTSGVQGFSSIPPQTSNYTISGVQTSSGVATIPGATPTTGAQVSGVQSIVPDQAISTGFAAGGGGF